jgi:hypothetical protein
MNLNTSTSNLGNRGQTLSKRVFAISLILLLTISAIATITLAPTASAHTPPWNIATYAYVQAAPSNPGVNQQVFIVFWLNAVYDGAALTNDYRFHNYQLKITSPTGKVETKTTSIVMDSTSSQYIMYTPTEVGTYTINFTFPGQAINSFSHANDAYINDSYLASSAVTTMTVSQEPLPTPITSGPMPSNFWTRPIYGVNTDWWSISSNWLGVGSPGYGNMGSIGSNQQSYIPDSVGPQTSHIMWSLPLQAGGVTGGDMFAVEGYTYFEGSAYNQRFANPIVMNGKLYYTVPLGFTGAPNSAFGGSGPFGPTNCVDLTTGKIIWSRTDVPPLSFGYQYGLYDPNQHGVFPPILFTANFGSAYDGDTGIWMFNVTNVPTATVTTKVNGPQGEQLRYVLANAGNTSNPDWRLGQWNSTKLWSFTGSSPAIAAAGMVNITSGRAIDASISKPTDVNVRYDWNVSIPWRNTMTTTPTVIGAFYNKVMICYNGSLPSITGSQTPYTYFAINLDPNRGVVGSVLWWSTVNPPSGNISIIAGGADLNSGVFFEGYRETMQWVGYSMADGHQLWGPTASQTAFDYYGNTGVSQIQGVAAFGNLYSVQYGGILYCYDLTTGELKYTYGTGGPGNSTFSGFYTNYDHYPTFIAAIDRNAVIYLVTSEHTATAPIFKGALARAIDARSGKELWTLSNYISILAGPGSTPPSYAIADGFASMFNGYDNQIYTVGRGSSATTVESTLTAVPAGGTVVIQGTVMDTSAGTKQTQQAADFPNGVPCAADVVMGDWMAYVYMQQGAPANFTGVPVKLFATFPDGHTEEIATATTDQSGLFSALFTPSTAGKYTITAAFEGTNSYWPSSAETTVGVVTAASPAATSTPVTTPPVTTPPSSPTSTATSAPQPGTDYTTVIYVAVAAVIIIVVIFAATVALRRRK